MKSKGTNKAMGSKRSYAEIYLLTCDLLKEDAEQKLERSLTSHELAHIYNAGFLMMLESVGRDIESSSKENLSQTLLSTYFLDRLDKTRREFPKILEENFLDQPLNQQIVEKINQLPYIYSLQTIILKMEQTPQEARYQELAHTLDELI